MLTLQMPTLLALLGTALMAIVIFAPERAVTPPTVSYAPPLAPPLERWYAPPLAHDAHNAHDAHDAEDAHADDPPGFDAPAQTPPCAFPAWPSLVDPRAAECDAGARLALVDALAAVRAPWARTILQRALDDEPDDTVRTALVRALS